MRRFSQRNSLVTLNDLNITPLLDLAFVLLIIFVITTQSLEQGMELTLPKGGQPDRGGLRKEDIQTVEIGRDGSYMLNGNRITLEQMEPELVKANAENPNTVVYIRTDRRSYSEQFVAVADILTRNGMTRWNIRTKPNR